MPKEDITAEFLRRHRERPRVRHFGANDCDKHPVRAPRTVFFLDDLERESWKRQYWRYPDKPSGRKRVSMIQTPPVGAEFLDEYRDYRGHQCLPFPDTPLGTRRTILFRGQSMQAARAMCILKRGEPDRPGLKARHLCGNGHMSCVNPMHLAWGTDEENSRDHLLHTQRPWMWPDLSAELMDEIQADPRSSNVLAVKHDVHAVIIRAIKDGRRPEDDAEISGTCEGPYIPA